MQIHVNSLAPGNLLRTALRVNATRPLARNQQWFKLWLSVIRQQAIAWANVGPYLCRHQAPISNVNQSASHLTNFDHCSSDLCIALCCLLVSPDSLKMFSCHIPLLSCAFTIHTCVFCVMNMKLVYIFQVSAYAGTTSRWIYIGAIKDLRVEIKSCCTQMPMPPGTWCQPAIYMT